MAKDFDIGGAIDELKDNPTRFYITNTTAEKTKTEGVEIPNKKFYD